MSTREEENWESGEPLREAWFCFADYVWPEGDRAATLRQLWRGHDGEALAEVDQRLLRAEQLERGLKKELLFQLVDGTFRAFGRDISDGFGSPLIELPRGVFDQSQADFSVDWDTSSLVSFGRKIIEVRLTPRLGAQKSTPRAKGGRPRKIDTLVDACRIAVARDPAFCGLQTKQALPIIEAILKTTLKTSQGFEGGVSEETLRRAKKAVCASD